MRTGRGFLLALLFVWGAAPAAAQIAPRTMTGAGMGVSWVSMADIADLANRASTGGERVSEFTSAVVFSGLVSVPLSADWAVALDYGYMVVSYTSPGYAGENDFTCKVHLPTLVFQYTLLREKTYAIRAGAGAGYWFGMLDQTLERQENSFNASGAGFLLNIEAQTAFSDDFYGSIAGEARWGGLGELTNETGQRPSVLGEPATLAFFGVGVRFGFAYHF